jgi:hypothetical protein
MLINLMQNYNIFFCILMDNQSVLTMISVCSRNEHTVSTACEVNSAGHYLLISYFLNYKPQFSNISIVLFTLGVKGYIM